jgi:hypothetical protein
LLLLYESGRLSQERQRNGRRGILQTIQCRVEVIGHCSQHRLLDDSLSGQFFNLVQATMGKTQMERWLGPRWRNPQPGILRRQLDRVECRAR